MWVLENREPNDWDKKSAFPKPEKPRTKWPTSLYGDKQWHDMINEKQKDCDLLYRLLTRKKKSNLI